MSAASHPITSPEASGEFIESQPIAAAVILYAGTLAAANAAGNLVPAADTVGLVVLGRVESNTLDSVFDNTSGAAGDLVATLKRGSFVLANSTVHPVTQANLGRVVYVEDNQTVAASSTHSIPAGILIGFLNGNPTLPIVDTRVAASLA